jgi:hypothetical protein
LLKVGPRWKAKGRLAAILQTKVNTQAAGRSWTFVVPANPI